MAACQVRHGERLLSLSRTGRRRGVVYLNFCLKTTAIAKFSGVENVTAVRRERILLEANPCLILLGRQGTSRPITAISKSWFFAMRHRAFGLPVCSNTHPRSAASSLERLAVVLLRFGADYRLALHWPCCGCFERRDMQTSMLRTRCALRHAQGNGFFASKR